MPGNPPARLRVETGIYERRRADGSLVYYEISYYDDRQKQRWKKVGVDLEEARTVRRALHTSKSYNRSARADLVQVNRMSQTIPLDKRTFLQALRETKSPRNRDAWLKISAFGLAMARQFDKKN